MKSKKSLSFLPIGKKCPFPVGNDMKFMLSKFHLSVYIKLGTPILVRSVVFTYYPNS